jgi:hypothetical protein
MEDEVKIKGSLVSMALLAALSASAVRAEEADDKPLAIIKGDIEGLHIDVLSLRRSEGNFLTLRVAFVNASGAPVKNSDFPGMNGSGWQPSLIDYKAKQKYGVIMFDDGKCLCTTNLIYNADFPPGRRVLWAKFRAPPESIRTMSLIAGNDEPLDDLPITR